MGEDSRVCGSCSVTQHRELCALVSSSSSSSCRAAPLPPAGVNPLGRLLTHQFAELCPCVAGQGLGCPPGDPTGQSGLWSGYFERVEDQLVKAVEQDSAAPVI